MPNPKAKTEAAKRLLKAVPNQKAYDKLSSIEKKEFNKAAKKAKLPMKKAPVKMVSAKDSNAAIKEKKRKTRNKVKRVVQGVSTLGASEVARKLTQSYKKYKAKKSVKNISKKAIKESMTETSQEALKGAKRGLKDSLKEAKTIKKRTIKKTLKVDNRGRRKSDRFKKPSEMTVYDYENDDRGMRTNPYKPDPSPGRLKASALKMKKSPALAKLSASCKAAARRKFKVYPSAYANMWASRTQKKGKC